MSRKSAEADREVAPPKPGDIQRTTYEHGAEPYRDPHVLRVLYHQCELSQRQIAEQCGVSQQTVHRWMKNLGVSTRPPSHLRDLSLSVGQGVKGKELYQIPDIDEESGEEYRYCLARHQLIALLCEDGEGNWAYSIGDVFGGDTHVHHEMSAPVAVDIPENLAVLSASEHMRLHGSGPPIISRVEATLDEIFDDYEGEPDPREIPAVAPADRRKRQRILRQYHGSRASEAMSGD